MDEGEKDRVLQCCMLAEGSRNEGRVKLASGTNVHARFQASMAHDDYCTSLNVV